VSNTLKHGFTSAKADDVDTSLIQPSHWNAEHTFAGGAMGSLLYRDTGATDGANWLADVAVGQVLVSGGVGAAPAFSATPSLTDLTLTGQLKSADGLIGAPGFSFSSETNTGMWRAGAGDLRFTVSGTDRLRMSGTTVIIPSTGSLGWGSSGISTVDTVLARDTANTLGMRNTTNGQTFRIYNTFTDGSNNERLTLNAPAGNTAQILTEAVGTGTARALRLGTSGNASLIFRTNGADVWSINGSGHLLASTDNSFDIGASGATRPRTLYLGTSLIVGSNFSVSSGGTITTVGGSGINFTSVSRIQSPSDGVVSLYNQAITDFGRLQFGGTTSAFPALKRSGTSIAARLADDSADAGLTAASITTSATTLHTTSAALTNGAGVATGTLTNAPAAGNPTKWIPINDNGTTRYIPAW
jgi:hypothetical protein